MISTIIIEDDPMVAQINRKYLEHVPEIQVKAVYSNGREALDAILADPPALIVLDVYMAGLSGLELLHQLRQKDVNSDVIMVTAANDVKDVNEALRLGIVDYLVKPFEYERFMEAIAKFLKKNHALRRDAKLDQEAIDRLFSAQLPGKQRTLQKGLQQRTLDMVRQQMRMQPSCSCSCETLSDDIGLSRVTVRRYLNYMAENGEVINTVDYSTGGRPGIIYTLKGQKPEDREF